MKAGDLVKWIGFPHIPPVKDLVIIGIIINVYLKDNISDDLRINVMWGTGNWGSGLLPETIEVINESR